MSEINETTTQSTNQSVFEDKAFSEIEAENIVDLTVDGETTEQIKGGLLLPAVQRVR